MATIRTIEDRTWIIPTNCEWYGQGVFNRAALTTPLVSGQILARRTSTGKLERYVNGGTDGLGTAIGICINGIDAGGNVNAVDDTDCVVSYLIHGIVIESKLVGMHSAVKTDLKFIMFT